MRLLVDYRQLREGIQGGADALTRGSPWAFQRLQALFVPPSPPSKCYLGIGGTPPEPPARGSAPLHTLGRREWVRPRSYRCRDPQMTATTVGIRTKTVTTVGQCQRAARASAISALAATSAPSAKATIRNATHVPPVAAKAKPTARKYTETTTRQKRPGAISRWVRRSQTMASPPPATMAASGIANSIWTCIRSLRGARSGPALHPRRHADQAADGECEHGRQGADRRLAQPAADRVPPGQQR